MSGDESRGAVWALVIGFAVLTLVTCAGAAVVLVAGGAAWLLTVPAAPVPVGGPIAISAAASPVRTPTARTVEGLFVYADALVTAEPPPARFSRPLPSTIDAFFEFADGDESFPPYSHVKELACEGTPAMNSAVVAAVRDAVAAGASAPDLDATWATIFQYCEPEEAPCAFLRGVVTGTESAAVKAPFWRALAPCKDAATAKAFERPDAPAEPLLERLFAAPPQPWSKRLESLVATQIRNGDSATALMAARVLGATDDPRAAKALLAIYAAERDSTKKRAVALALYRQSDPAAKALYDAVCANLDEPEPACDPQASVPVLDPTTAISTSPIEFLLNDYAVDMTELLAANESTRRDELVAALEKCGNTYTSWRGRRCLSALAALDWKRASAIAARMSMPDEADVAELRQVLRLFDDRPTLIARLRTDGVLKSADVLDARVTSLRELLDGAGRAYDFDVETGGWPTGHDVLLRRLARLARPELDGILVLETPPPTDENGESDGSPYGLDAWIGGRHWHVDAEDRQDWFDLSACLGLLNRILRDRGSNVRLLTLATDDQTAVVVAGDEAGLARLVKDRLLVPADPDESAKDGKAFEQQALDALRRRDDAPR